MGNPLTDQEEAAAVAELSLLSEGAKGWLAHHMRNELQKFMFEPTSRDLTRSIVNNMVEDLIKIGC